MVAPGKSAGRDEIFRRTPRPTPRIACGNALPGDPASASVSPIGEVPHRARLVRLRPRPGATALRQRALDHDAIDELPPVAIERAVLVGRGQRDAAFAVVLGPHAGPLVVDELAGHRGLAGAVLGVRPGRLALLVGRRGRDRAVDILLDHTVEPAALPRLLEGRHPVGRELLPRAG